MDFTVNWKNKKCFDFLLYPWMKFVVPSIGSMIQVGSSVNWTWTPGKADSSPMNLKLKKKFFDQPGRLSFSFLLTCASEICLWNFWSKYLRRVDRIQLLNQLRRTSSRCVFLTKNLLLRPEKRNESESSIKFEGRQKRKIFPPSPEKSDQTDTILSFKTYFACSWSKFERRFMIKIDLFCRHFL